MYAAESNNPAPSLYQMGARTLRATSSVLQDLLTGKTNVYLEQPVELLKVILPPLATELMIPVTHLKTILDANQTQSAPPTCPTRQSILAFLTQIAVKQSMVLNYFALVKPAIQKLITKDAEMARDVPQPQMTSQIHALKRRLVTKKVKTKLMRLSAMQPVLLFHSWHIWQLLQPCDY